jgi:hypothetical protein
MGAEGGDTRGRIQAGYRGGDDWELGWTFSPYAVDSELVVLEHDFED